ncbi:hypothetical protein HK102_009514, partial [Quaeritorhiza haematococci]
MGSAAKNETAGPSALNNVLTSKGDPPVTSSPSLPIANTGSAIQNPASSAFNVASHSQDPTPSTSAININSAPKPDEAQSSISKTVAPSPQHNAQVPRNDVSAPSSTGPNPLDPQTKPPPSIPASPPKAANTTSLIDLALAARAASKPTNTTTASLLNLSSTSKFAPSYSSTMSLTTNALSSANHHHTMSPAGKTRIGSSLHNLSSVSSRSSPAISGEGRRLFAKTGSGSDHSVEAIEEAVSEESSLSRSLNSRSGGGGVDKDKWGNQTSGGMTMGGSGSLKGMKLMNASQLLRSSILNVTGAGASQNQSQIQSKASGEHESDEDEEGATSASVSSVESVVEGVTNNAEAKNNSKPGTKGKSKTKSALPNEPSLFRSQIPGSIRDFTKHSILDGTKFRSSSNSNTNSNSSQKEKPPNKKQPTLFEKGNDAASGRTSSTASNDQNTQPRPSSSSAQGQQQQTNQPFNPFMYPFG